MDMKELIDKLAAIQMNDMLNTIKEFDRRTWILIGTGAFIFILFFMFVVSPGWIKRPGLKKQSKDIETQMVKLTALSKKKPELEKQKKEIQAFIDDFQKKLFTDEETTLLLGKISKIAEDAQVELIASKPLDNVDPFPDAYMKKYKKYIYQLTVEGSYHRIATFISLLESYAQYFQIQSLGITPQLEKSEKHIGEIRLMAVSHNNEVQPIAAAPVVAGNPNVKPK